MDRVPDVAPLPPGSRMTLLPNPVFVGREEVLLTVARVMQAGSTLAIHQPLAMTGLGGMGKTQVAVEFAWRYGRFFPGGVFWLNMAEAESVPGQVAACGGPGGLDLPGWAGQEQEEQVARLQAEWQKAVPRLLIFDNCEEEGLLQQWRPLGGGARLLVTSRRALWDGVLGVQGLPLQELTPQAALELLERTIRQGGGVGPLTEAEQAGLAAIARELDYLPLALHLAGSFLHRYWGDVTPAAYLAEVRAQMLGHRSLRGGREQHSYTGHDLSVYSTFEVSLKRLDETDVVDRAARHLLAVAAHLAPGEAIPRPLLRVTAAGEPCLTDEDEPDGYLSRDGRRRLQELGLLEAAGETTARLHRLLAMFVREAVADGEAQAAAEQAVLDWMGGQGDKAGFYGQQPLLESHLRHVTTQAQTREDERAALLCNQLGYYLNQRGDLSNAEPFYQRALDIREKVLGDSHPDTALSLNNMGGLLDSMGRLAEARPFYQRALDIREKVLGDSHPDTAQSLNNMGYLLQAMGQLAEARPYYQRALDISEKVLGDSHPATATSLNNMAWLCHDEGNLPEAARLMRRALAICEQRLGPDHPDTQSSRKSLATIEAKLNS